jgi:hypothetical protein
MNQRSEFVLRNGAENFRALFREYGISARVGSKRLKRYEEEGLPGKGGAEPATAKQRKGVDGRKWCAG